MGTDGPILAIETSTPIARVVVVDRRTGARLAGAQAEAVRHSSNLLRLCAEVMEAARLSVPALGAIACGAGPGSFTGLRVGLAVTKGLAMPFGIPLVLVSSLEALAMDMLPATAPGETLLPCLDAGKGQIFAQLFERRGDRDVAAVTEEWAVLPDAAAPRSPPALAIAYAGTGAIRYFDVLAAGFGVRGHRVDCAGPTADSVARRATERLARGETDDLATAVPSYGRAPDITRPKRQVP
jgi:tRNA threonylcarbamoyladenosine biosynthesis protein TsaB